MDIKKSFGVDKELANNGKWFNLEDGGRVKVALLSNPAFTAEVQRLQKPHLAVLRSNLDTTDLVTSISIKAMAKTILVDWEGITHDDQDFPYSPENAEFLLTEYSYFKEIISILSTDRKNYSLEDIAGK